MMWLKVVYMLRSNTLLQKKIPIVQLAFSKDGPEDRINYDNLPKIYVFLHIGRFS